MKTLLWIVGILAILAVIWFLVAQPEPVPLGATPQNATYVIGGETVTLVNGAASEPAAPGSASTVTTRWFGNEALGDMDGDGTPDTAAIIVQDAGGSGTFFYAVVAVKEDGGYRGSNGVLLGDRIAPQPTQIRDEVAIYNYAVRKEGEPMSAKPTVGTTTRLVLDRGGELVSAEE